SRALGGWEVSGVAAFESGTPNTIHNANGDRAGVNSDFGQFGVRAAGCNVNSAPRSVAQWFSTSCASEAPAGTFGNAGRHWVGGPGARNWDFALYKNGKVT